MKFVYIISNNRSQTFIITLLCNSSRPLFRSLEFWQIWHPRSVLRCRCFFGFNSKATADWIQIGETGCLNRIRSDANGIQCVCRVTCVRFRHVCHSRGGHIVTMFDPEQIHLRGWRRNASTVERFASIQRHWIIHYCASAVALPGAPFEVTRNASHDGTWIAQTSSARSADTRLANNLLLMATDVSCLSLGIPGEILSPGQTKHNVIMLPSGVFSRSRIVNHRDLMDALRRVEQGSMDNLLCGNC